MTHRSRTRSGLVRLSGRRAALACIAGVLATLVGCADQPTAPAAAASSASSASNDKFDLQSANATLAWEATARKLVASHSTSPIAAARNLALLGIGQYGAVVAADGGAEPNAGGRALYEARRGAVAGASASVLSYIYPDAAATLENQVLLDGAAGPGETHPHFTLGVEMGRAMGARMIEWAKADGLSAPFNPKMVEAPLGGWVGAAGPPAGYQFPKMKPYYYTDQSKFRPGPHPAVGSPDFLAALAAVKAATVSRTKADVDMANFWNLSNGTITAIGYWDERADEFITAARFDERDAAHVFALMNSAAMDAIIGCWDAKYYYMLLRPSMADPSITRPAGIPATATTPAFPYGLPNHPSYPSGHSCVSAAAAQVLIGYFPGEAASLNDQVAAAGRSRVIGGIHYPFDITAGQALGRSVAGWAVAYDQQPGGLLRAIP